MGENLWPSTFCHFEVASFNSVLRALVPSMRLREMRFRRRSKSKQNFADHKFRTILHPPPCNGQGIYSLHIPSSMESRALRSPKP